jgi:hypothetical protein
MTSQYLWNLSEAIARMHDCSVTHSETVRVIEKVGGEFAFNGDVEIFDLLGHPKATKAFGWAWKDGAGEIQYIGVLNVPPIDSPREAVQAAIASGRFN